MMEYSSLHRFSSEETAIKGFVRIGVKGSSRAQLPGPLSYVTHRLCSFAF